MTISRAGASDFRIAAKLDLDGFQHADDANRLPGFSNNGDLIILPTSSNGPMYYLNSAGGTVWTKLNPNAVVAGADHWCGFWLSNTSANLWAVVVDVVAGSDTYHLVHINSLGSVTNIGNFSPATDFVATPLWSTLGVSLTWNWDGDSRFHLTGEGKDMTFTNAAVIDHGPQSLFDLPDPANASQTPCYYCGSGVYVQSFFMSSNEEEFAYLSDSQGRVAVAGISGLAGIFTGHVIPIEWNGYVALFGGTNSNLLYGARYFEAAEFNAKMIQLAQRNGLGG